jgi:U3 small nucleolar RNA-associated protein 19
MPGTIKDAAAKASSKRKRQENGEATKKRRKSGGGGEIDQQPNIEQLETEIIESRKHYNNIVTLISIANDSSSDPKAAFTAAEALCRVFIQLLALGNLASKKDASEKDATVTTWLRERLSEYQAALISMLYDEKLAVKALMLAMALVKAVAQHLEDKEDSAFPKGFFFGIVAAALQSSSEQLRAKFSEKFLTEYDDIRFYTFQGIKYAPRRPILQGRR